MRFLHALVPVLLFSGGMAAPSLATTPCDPHYRCDDNRLAARIADMLEEPERSVVMHGQSHPTLAIRIAAAELLWMRAREHVPYDVEIQVVAAAELIDAYLAAGLSKAATDTFEALDDKLRERLQIGTVVYGYTGDHPHTLHIERSPQLTAAGLAVAFAELGQTARADALLKVAQLPVQAGPRETLGADVIERSQRVGQCVSQLLRANPHSDWFAWRFDDTPGSRTGNGCDSVLAARAYTRLAARLLDTSGMPEQWRVGAEPNEQPDTHIGEEERLAAAIASLPDVRDRITALKPQLAELDRRDARWITLGKRLHDWSPFKTDATEKAAPSPLDLALARKLNQRLAQPLFSPYSMIAVAGKERPRRKSTERGPPATTCPLPTIRCSMDGAVRWELYASSDYDPSGEVPAAGLWLRSRGERERVYYLGLKDHLPYELVESNAPMIVDRELRLRVRRAELDRSTLMYPPLGLQFKRDGAVVELRAALEDIARDSDGDGLTDLAEQQLLLDPHAADTDGDGIPDADDRLPGVAFDGSKSARQSALATALGFIAHSPDQAISLFVPGSKTFAARQSAAEKTLFITADPADLTGLTSDGRVIVLPTSLDNAELRKHPAFSVLMSTQMSLKMFDDGVHAELVYSAGWAGGTLALELKDGVWRVGQLIDWVT